MGSWSQWREDYGSSPVYYDIYGSDGDYDTFDEYSYGTENNKTSNESNDEDYLNFSYDTPIATNCTCKVTHTKSEFQSRHQEAIKEGTIGGIPCEYKKETRDCKCQNYGISC